MAELEKKAAEYSAKVLSHKMAIHDSFTKETTEKELIAAYIAGAKELPKEKELKTQLDVLDSYINDIPNIFEVCRLCEFIDNDKQSHFDHVDVCEGCCWHYASKFKMATGKKE